MHVDDFSSVASLVGLFLLLPFSSHAQNLSDLPSCAVRQVQRSFSSLNSQSSLSFPCPCLFLPIPHLDHQINSASLSFPPTSQFPSKKEELKLTLRPRSKVPPSPPSARRAANLATSNACAKTTPSSTTPWPGRRNSVRRMI